MGDLTPLASLPGLRSLVLSATPVSDLAPLTALTDLDRLGLSECDQVVDLVPLAQLAKLTYLDVAGVRHPLDLAPLARHRHLTIELNRGQEVRGTKQLGPGVRLKYRRDPAP